MQVDTVYVGGGTPTVLPAGFHASLLRRLGRRADLSGLREATIEANPATVDPSCLRTLREAGFDRLSLGVQSLHDGHLRLLGRSHDAARAARAFEEARGAGFRRISVDMIYGIPGQTIEELEADLLRIVGWRPEHISAYELTLEPGTVITRLCDSGRLRAADESLLLSMYTMAHGTLTRAGYDHYEVSSFSLGGCEASIHNSACWAGRPYLGLGPSAHSFDGGRRRWWNASDTAGWTESLLAGHRPPGGGEGLSALQRANEVAMLGLRTSRGIALDRILAETGMEPSPKGRAILDGLVEGDFLRRTGSRILPSPEGMLLADGIVASLDWREA